MKFKKEVLKELVFGGDGDGFKMIKQPEIVDNGRWSLTYEFIFQAPDGKFYSGYYSEGATEQQDHAPFEYEDDEMELDEVRPVEKTITVYEVVK